MDSQRYLRCLGQPALFAPNGDPIRFRTRKHLALLVYLAVENRSHRRDRLAELLWPKVSSTEARHSLATGLSVLRPRLGLDALETSRDHVRLVPGSVALDLERLRSGDVLGSEVTEPLQVAAFLDGFDIADSAEFTLWKDQQQAALLPVIKDALLLLIDRCRRTGDTRQIEQVADRMLALDYLCEDAIRAKMEARAFAGDRLTALEIFEGWKKKLAEELGAAPSDLVEGMAVRLRRRGWERSTLANIPNVPTDQWRGRPFIGRAEEYRVLYEQWEAAQKGFPGHALVLGDSGVGKTTLVQRLTTAAGLQGAAISRVQCYDLEREIPYSTLNGLVIGLLDRPGVSATSPEALAELGRIIPEVRLRFPSLPLANESQRETARIRLTEAFLQMLRAIADEQPTILVVDDLHRADSVSLAVLHLVIRRAIGHSLMVIMIARPGELNQSTQAARLRESASRLGICEIDLAPLSSDESADLLRCLLDPDGDQPNGVEKHALLKASAGFPMVLELLVQDWKSSRQQCLALALSAMTTDLVSTGSAYLAYRHLLARITRTLDCTTLNVLNLAAILGPHLNNLTMYALVDLSAGQTMTGMANLVARRVLRDGPRGLEFVNELVRGAAYLGVSPSLRKILHSRIADRFIQQTGGRADLGLEIAWHCIRSGRTAEAQRYLLEGAHGAIRCGAPYEAERGLSTALPQLVEPERSQALLLLSEALQEQSRWMESLNYLDQLETDSSVQVLPAAFVLKTRAHRRLGVFDVKELTAVPARLLEFIRSATDPVSSIQAAVEAASILETLRCNSVVPAIQECLSELQLDKLEVDDAANLLLAQSMLHYQMKDFTASLACAREAIGLLERNDHQNSVLAMLQNGLGAIFTKQGLYEESVPEYLKCYHTSTRVGNDRIYVQASANLSLSLMRMGEYEKAITWGERSLTNSVALLNMGYGFQGAEGSVFSYAMTSTNLSRAEQLIVQTRADLEAHAPLGVSRAWALYSADAYAMMGKVREAEEEARRGINCADDHIHMDFCSGPYARWIARISLLTGNAIEAMRGIDFLLRELRMYDALDQAEILNAKCWLQSRSEGLAGGDFHLMLGHLERLPRAVTEQLNRMGMLDFC